MGAGDRYQQPRFTVPMPAAAAAWPFTPRTTRYCPLCDRLLWCCECEAKEEK